MQSNDAKGWGREADRIGINLRPGGLTAGDRQGSVQVVSSTNGELANDDPATGQSNTPITGAVDVDVVSETKYEVDRLVNKFFSNSCSFADVVAFTRRKRRSRRDKDKFYLKEL